jgi:hypothetical protein
MREREARRKYNLELAGAFALYAAVLTASIVYAGPMPPGTARTLLLLSPMLPTLLVGWVIFRQFRRMDEFVRLRSLENMAVANSLVALAAFSYGFLENAGFPKISMFWVWGAMGAIWALVTITRCVADR